jgi:hypothetical protein
VPVDAARSSGHSLGGEGLLAADVDALWDAGDRRVGVAIGDVDGPARDVGAGADGADALAPGLDLLG